MARRRFSSEEVEQWQKDHNQSLFYINKNDANLFVRRRNGFGRTVNLTHPGAWVIIAAIVAFVVVTRVFGKSIFR